jgi:hypothetical protein
MVSWLYVNWAIITFAVAVALFATRPKGWVLLWLVAACFIDSVMHDAINFSAKPKPAVVQQHSLKNT